MPVNTSDPIGAKARFALRGSEGTQELVKSVSPTGGTLSSTSTAWGAALVPSTTPTKWTYVDTSVDPVVSGDFTTHWYGLLKTNTTQDLIDVSSSDVYGWKIYTAAYSPDVLLLGLYSFFRAHAASNLIYSLNESIPHSIAVRYTESTTTADFFLDGTLIASKTWLRDVSAIGAGQSFSINGDATNPHKHITSQVYAGALSDAEIAALVADPFAIFLAPPVTLAAFSPTQTNTAASGEIAQPGNLSVASCLQTNSAGVGSVTTTQTLVIASATQQNAASTISLDPYKRLRALLKSVPKGEWLKVNTNTFMGIRVPAGDDAPGNGALTHYAVANAWPGFAWDTASGNLILWGGGHANYIGNEVYIWDGNAGTWGLGSLPSALDAEYFVTSKDAPQSSHTYGNNVYLPNNNMFCSFGGAASPSGSAFKERTGSGPTTQRTVGPWCFDLTLANPNKVGGGTGTGWDTTTVKAGSNAWYNRIDMVDAAAGSPSGYPQGNHVNGAAVAVNEGGVDVVYVTVDNSSGFPVVGKYTFGDIRAGGRDTYKALGRISAGVIGEGWGVWDSKRNMFYRNSSTAGSQMVAVYIPVANYNYPDVAIRIEDSGGTLMPSKGTPGPPADAWDHQNGAVYNEHDDLLYFWNGWQANTGEYWTVAIPDYDPVTGWASTTWTGTKHTPVGATPRGHHTMSILGRMRYVPTLKAVVIIDQPSSDGTNDASVWMLKTTEAEIDLAAASGTQTNNFSSGSITQTHALSVQTSAQTNAASSGAVSQGAVEHFLICAPSVQDNIAWASAVVQAHILAGANGDQANACSTGAVTQTDGIPPVDAPAGSGPRLRIPRGHRPRQLR